MHSDLLPEPRSIFNNKKKTECRKKELTARVISWNVNQMERAMEKKKEEKDVLVLTRMLFHPPVNCADILQPPTSPIFVNLNLFHCCWVFTELGNGIEEWLGQEFQICRAC